tara:strand:+ start:477 stop:935 length:459 start_codon:yes stop_codon:yes gene_type:complete
MNEETVVNRDFFEQLKECVESYFSEAYGQENFNISHPSRLRKYVDARRIFVMIVYDTWPERVGIGLNSTVARYLGKNHATTLHAEKSGRVFLETDGQFAERYHRVKEMTQSVRDRKYLPYLSGELETAKNRVRYLSKKIKEIQGGNTHFPHN